MTPTEHSLIDRAKVFIQPLDAKRAEEALARVLEKDGAADGALAALLLERPQARDLLLGVLGASPYLTDLSARDPARLARILIERSRAAHRGADRRNAKHRNAKTKPS